MMLDLSEIVLDISTSTFPKDVANTMEFYKTWTLLLILGIGMLLYWI